MIHRRTLTIRPADEVGFTIADGDRIVAAFETFQQAAAWLDGQYADPNAIRPGDNDSQDMPRMLVAPPEPEPRNVRALFQR